MLEWIRFIVGAILVLAGLFTIVTSVIGNYKFKFVLNRMHSAAMGDTLGILFVLLGLILFSGWNFTSLKILFVIVLLWIGSPVSSHLLVRLEVATDEEIHSEVDIIEETDGVETVIEEKGKVDEV